MTVQAEEGIALCFSVIKDPSCYRFCFSEASALRGCHKLLLLGKWEFACSLAF